jgi:hypothetical protein
MKPVRSIHDPFVDPVFHSVVLNAYCDITVLLNVQTSSSKVIETEVNRISRTSIYGELFI